MTTTQASIIIEKLEEVTSQSAITINKLVEISLKIETLITLFIIFGFTILLFKYILNIRLF